jgi:hypothetical protein
MKDWKDMLWEKIKDEPYLEWLEKLNKQNNDKRTKRRKTFNA